MATVVVTVACGDVRGEESLESKWRREYPPAAARLELAIQTFSASGHSSARFNSGAMRKNESLTIAASRGRKLIVSEGRSQRDPDAHQFIPDGSLVSCEAPDYVFALSRPNKSSPYKIEAYGPNSNDPLLAMDFKLATGAATYLGHTLLSRMQSPTFEIQSCEKVSIDGRELVSVAYKGKIGLREESGTVHLDPALGWVIREIDVRFHDIKGNALNLLETIEYPAGDSAPFLPSRFEWTLKTPRPEIFESHTVEFDDIRPGEPPDSMFRLSGYGLPDIPLSPQPGPNFYSWGNPLFWASLATAVASFILLGSIKWRPRSQTA